MIFKFYKLYLWNRCLDPGKQDGMPENFSNVVSGSVAWILENKAACSRIFKLYFGIFVWIPGNKAEC